MWQGKEVIKNIEIKRFFSAFERVCSPDFSFHGEAHNFWELLFVVSGEVIVSADERVYSLSKDDIIFHKPMEFHKFRGTGKTGFHIFVISFECTGEVMKNLNNRVLHLTEEQKMYIDNLINFAKNNVTGNLGEGFYMELYDKIYYFPQMFSNMAENFLMSCIKDLQVITSELKTYKTRVYKNAVNLMESNVTKNITIPEIAKECGVSISYLKNIFSEYAGTGVHKFFLNLKIAEACKLLKDGFMVSEVSEILAFSTQNYFSAVFKRETGISPTEYKKNGDFLIQNS